VNCHSQTTVRHSAHGSALSTRGIFACFPAFALPRQRQKVAFPALLPRFTPLTCRKRLLNTAEENSISKEEDPNVQQQDGADAGIKGKIKEEGTLPPGIATFEQRLADALAVGVKFQLCQQVAVNRGLKKEDLIDGTQILGGIHLINYALEYDGMLFF
jgi:predicted peroxiredoxin